MRKYRRGRVWYIDYRSPKTGRRVRKKVGKSKKDAGLALAEIQRQIFKGEYFGVVERKKVIFDKLCEEYLTYCKTHNAFQTHRRKKGIIKRLLNSFHKKLISQITAHDVERYKRLRRSEVSPASVNRELACLKHMFTLAVHWQYLGDNPLRLVKNFKEPPGRTRYLTEEEEELLLINCANYIKPIVIMALETGMRKGEILNLKWSEVDMIAGIIRIEKAKNNETRSLPINGKLYDLLISMKCDAGTQYVFAHKNGKPYRDIRDGFKAALRRAGIGNFRFHDLRHTFASRLAMKNVGIRIIQELLGQKTIAMTTRYSHLSIKSLREAVDKLHSEDYNDPGKWHKYGTNAMVKKCAPAKH